MFEPKCLATGIGSLPNTDVEKACRSAIEYFPDIPFWPQLPKLSFTENMYVQYSEHLPGRVIDADKIYIDLSHDNSPEMEGFYNDYMEGNIDKFSQTQDYCHGLFKMLELKNELTNIKIMKGQLTGPISFGLQVVDENTKPIYYDDSMRDIMIKNLKMKARWQEEMLAKICSTTIISVDEPYLSAIGSAVFSLNRDVVLENIEEVLSGLKGLKGTHCCGNTDWSLLMETSVNILFLDAYSYAKSLALYPDEVRDFLDRGGVIGWGIVPSIGDDLRHESIEGIVKRLESAIQLLVDKGIKLEDILHQSLITPSCGVGSQEIEDAENALIMTCEVAKIMREKYELE